MKRRLMHGGFAAALLSGVAGAALAASALDAPMLLADRSLVRLERLDIAADPASGEPSPASRRQLERLLADEARRDCVVAAQVLGRIDRAELDGGDPLEAHRRARARAERTAAALGAAGIERDRIVAGWDSSRPGDPGRMTIWLLTDWSEPGCGLLPSDEAPRIAAAPPPSGVGFRPAQAELALPAAPATVARPDGVPEPAAGRVTSGHETAPTAPVRLALASPSTGTGAADTHAPASMTDPPTPAATAAPNALPLPAEPARTASAETVPIAAPPGSTHEPATAADPAALDGVTPATSRPNALDTLAALFGRIGRLFERDTDRDAPAPASPTPHPDLRIASGPVTATITLAGPGEATAAPGPSPRSMAAAEPILADTPASVSEPAAGAAFATPGPVRVAPSAPVTTAAASTVPPPAPPPPAVAMARPDPSSPRAGRRSLVASADLPEPEGGLREPDGAPLPPIAAASARDSGAPAALPEPAAGSAQDELAFRFPANSSILDPAQKKQLEALARQLPTDRPVHLRLNVAVGSGDVAGADEAGARRYNRWLAERRAARIERWLRHYAGDRALTFETSLHEDDPSRTARLSLVSGR